MLRKWPTKLNDRRYSELDGSSGFRLNGAWVNHRAGRAVGRCGDVNGDGIGNLLIGAPGFEQPPFDHWAGASYVVFDRTTGFPARFDLDGTNGFRLNGIDGFDYSGRSVSAVSDFNGDRFDDLLHGAPSTFYHVVNPTGEAYVVFGGGESSATSVELAALTSDTGVTLTGVAAGDHTGDAVSSAGDFNGDGFDDLIVGARSP